MGYAQARGVFPKVCDDVQPFLDGRPEVGRSPCQVGLEEVIGPNPDREESTHEGSHDFRIVVYPFEKNRLAT